jgi:hypothetical protein
VKNKLHINHAQAHQGCSGKSTDTLPISSSSGRDAGARQECRCQTSQLHQTHERLDIHVCHFPPGTSKWNKVEHRLFCYISKNWQGKPLIDVETAISLIGSTTTATGLEVICQRDDTVYKTAQSVSDEEYESIPLTHLAPFGSWNYVLNHS